MATGYGDFELKDVFQDCSNKLAFLLPEVEAYPLYYELLKNKPEENVYIGKEEYFSLDYGLVFLRWVDPKMIHGAQIYYSNGLGKYWMDFIAKFWPRLRSGYAGKERKEHTAASMKGNIVVVFVCLPIGFLAGLVGLLGENRERFRTVLRIIKKCIRQGSLACFRLVVKQGFRFK